MKESIYYDVTPNGIKGENQPLPSSVDSHKGVSFLHAENKILYGERPYERLDASDNPVDDNGKWILHRSTEEVDEAWQIIKGSIREGHLWNCKVSTKNDEFQDHVICIYSLCYRDLPDIVEKFNVLFAQDLIKPDESIVFKANAQTRKEMKGDYLYRSDDLPELLLNYLRKRFERLRVKRALSEEDLNDFQNSILELQNHIQIERGKKSSAGVILQAELVTHILKKTNELPEKVLNECLKKIGETERNYQLEFPNLFNIEAKTLNWIKKNRKKATPHLFFEMKPVKLLMNTADTPAYLLSHLEDKIEALNPDEEFTQALLALTADLKDALQIEKNLHLSHAEMMESGPVKCTIETLRLLISLTGTDSKTIKQQAIATYENQFCQNSSLLKKVAKACALVVITALGFILGAGIGALIGIFSGAWSGPGAVASGVLGLLTGAVEGASLGLVIGSTVTGISLSAVSGYLLYKPASTKNLVKQAKALIQEEGEEKEENLVFN